MLLELVSCFKSKNQLKDGVYRWSDYDRRDVEYYAICMMHPLCFIPYIRAQWQRQSSA